MVEHARAVIIGGGVGGTSIAYHLAELGWTDIVLVDRAELTSGSTFHSAGLVGQLRSSVTLTKMMMYGADLYRRLRDETGVDPSWHEVGSLRLASSKARFEELQRQVGWARTFGLPLELISAAEARDRFPLMSTDGVLGAVWLPTDGWLDPSGLAQALAAGRTEAWRADPDQHPGRGDHRGSRARHRRRGRARAASGETIATDVVVNAGGMFAPEIGRLAGVTIPIIPMAHQYLFTEAIEGVDPGHAPAARPGQPRLLPRGGRRAVHGRLRAEPGALVAGRRPARTSTASSLRPTGRGSRRSWPEPSGASRRSPTPG